MSDYFSKNFKFIFLSLLFIFCHGRLPAAEWTDAYLPGSDDTVQNTQLDSLYGSSTREVIVLNGEWQARRMGEESWYRVRVPGAYDFEGEIEFKRTFVIDSTFSGHAFQLIALGVSNRSKLFLNGQFIGSHDRGHTSFVIDLDRNKLNLGAANELTVITDNSLQPRAGLPLQHSPGLPHNHGGIFRDIFLLAKPRTSLSHPVIAKEFADEMRTCHLALASTIHQGEKGVEGNLDFFVELWNSDDGSLVIRSRRIPLEFQNAKAKVDQILTVENFELWAPERPLLYELRAYVARNRVIVDEVRLNIGFNQFSVRDGTFQLNQEPIKLKGVDWYEMFPASGRVADWPALEQDMRAIKQLGANAVHVIGGAPHPYLLSICDKIGLLVFEELPISFVPPPRFADPAFVEQVASYFEEMVERDRVHPSLAAIGVGRDLKLSRRDFPADLKEVLRKTRVPVYQSYRFFTPENLSPEIDFVWTDLCQADPDPEQFFSRLTHVTQPVIVSCGSQIESPNEFRWLANDAAPNQVDDRKTSILIEEWQAAKLHRIIQQLSEQLDPDGLFIHTFADWQGSHPNLAFTSSQYPWWNQTGLVTFERERRIAYELVHDLFKEEEPLQTSVQPSADRNPNIYPIVGLGLVLLFLFIFKRSRRFRGNLRRIYLFPHGFYTELRENRRVPVWHTLALSFLSCTIFGVVLSGLTFTLRHNALFDEILNHLLTAELKIELNNVIWEPILSIAVFALAVFLIAVVVSVVLRTASFVLGVRLPLIQFVTLVFWAAANFILLLPIVPIYHRLLMQSGWLLPGVVFVGLFGLWFVIRLIRAIKMTFVLSPLQMLVLLTVFFIVFGGGLGWYADKELALFDYIPLYWEAAQL